LSWAVLPVPGPPCLLKGLPIGTDFCLTCPIAWQRQRHRDHARLPNLPVQP
jgi:hypothetical protein